MELLIFYLTDSNREFTFQHYINLLNTSQKKNEWKLLILTHGNNVQFYINSLSNYDINYEIKYIDPEDNYMKKVNFACEYAETNNIPYMLKCDNDIFIKSNTLDYMIDNLHLLETNKHLTIGPVLSSGIPGVEYFKEQFLDENAIDTLEKLFLKTTFYDRDGTNYTFLNKHTIHNTNNKWSKEEYFKSVYYMNQFYKGMHPIRINEESLQYLNNYIIENKDRFMENKELSIIDNDNSPYLCNSIFCIKRETYKKILHDKSLFVDAFDEVSLNKYAWINDMNHLFIKNGFAIHMYYNWRYDHINKEREFCDKFFG